MCGDFVLTYFPYKEVHKWSRDTSSCRRCPNAAEDYRNCWLPPWEILEILNARVTTQNSSGHGITRFLTCSMIRWCSLCVLSCSLWLDCDYWGVSSWNLWHFISRISGHLPAQYGVSLSYLHCWSYARSPVYLQWDLAQTTRVWHTQNVSRTRSENSFKIQLHNGPVVCFGSPRLQDWASVCTPVANEQATRHASRAQPSPWASSKSNPHPYEPMGGFLNMHKYFVCMECQ